MATQEDTVSFGLLRACEKNSYKEIVSRLDANSVNVVDHHGRTPLHWTVKHKNTVATMHLLRRNPLINMADGDGNTPLHVAAWKDSEQIVRMLLEHGADINAQNRFGQIPLHRAAHKGFTEVVERLVAAEGGEATLVIQDSAPGGGGGAEDGGAGAASAGSPGGWTWLHYAARHGQQEVVAAVAAAVAPDVLAMACGITDARHRTAREVAAAHNHAGLAAYLARPAAAANAGDVAAAAAVAPQPTEIRSVASSSAMQPAAARIEGGASASAATDDTSTVVLTTVAPDNWQARLADLEAKASVVPLMQAKQEAANRLIHQLEMRIQQLEGALSGTGRAAARIPAAPPAYEAVVDGTISAGGSGSGGNRGGGRAVTAAAPPSGGAAATTSVAARCAACSLAAANAVYACGHMMCHGCDQGRTACRVCQRPITMRMTLH